MTWPADLRARTRATLRALAAGIPQRAGLAARAALCLAVPLAVGLAVGQPADGAAASFGALAGLSVPQSPFRYRARVVAAVGAGLVAAVLCGGLAASHGWLAALVAGLVAGLASLGCQAAELPPPRELMVVMAVLAATDLATGPGDALRRAGLAALGALVAWLITLSPALVDRRAPERRAVTAAFAAVADLVDAVGTDRVAAARHGAILAVRRARAAVEQAGLAPANRLAGAVVAVEPVLEAALHVEVEGAGPVDPGWARSVRALGAALAEAPAADPRPDPDADPDPAPATGPARPAGGALGAAIAGARAAVLGREPADRPPLRRWPGFWPQLRAALRRRSLTAPAALRIGVAVAVAVGFGRAFGLGHAYWLGLTVAAVLQVGNLTATRGRVVARVLGTAVGAGLAFALLGWGPPLWVVVLAAAACQLLVELVIPTSYALAAVAITVLALLLFHVGAPDQDVGAAIGARLLDTALGSALALLLRRVLWPAATSARLPQVQARAVAATRRVLAAAWQPGGEAAGPAPEALVRRRRDLYGELAVLRAVQADALADGGARASTADRRWPVTAAAEQLAVLALARPDRRGPPPAAAADAFLRHLDALAAALVDDGDPGPAPTALPDHPHTLAAGAALTGAVRSARTPSPGS